MGRKAQIYVTQGNGDLAFEAREFTPADTSACRVTLRSWEQRQEVFGFGAALTEASAHVFAQMPAAVQEEFLRMSFAQGMDGGNAYTLCRSHIQSCDFGLGNYAYVERADKGKDPLATFDMSHDEQELFPFIRRCLQAQPCMSLILAPWSPPAFMKTNRCMNFGGRLRLKYYAAWAQIMARAVAEWRKAGLPVERVTVQNEPEALQTWDSCLYTASQEAHFAAVYLRPALDAAGCEDVKILAWDHNKDALIRRVEDADRALNTPSVREQFAHWFARLTGSAPVKHRGERAQSFDDVFSGVAFHWYTGDYFEQVEHVHRVRPHGELIHTEGCEAFSNGMGRANARDAEHYAHDIIGDMNAGANGYIDWNILLDERGGPNHVGNYCDAPLMYNRQTQRLEVNRSYCYLGHFSRFIAPGSHVAPVDMDDSVVEALGAVSPAGRRTLVLLNRNDSAVRMQVGELAVGGGDYGALGCLELEPHSIATVVWG